MKCLNSLCIIFLFSLTKNGVVYSKEDYFSPNVENCGMRDVIPGELRTSTPWTITIFRRANDTSPYKYFMTGGLITSTAVYTIFGGGYGQPYHKNPSKKYYIPPSSQFLVAAGLKSTDINDKDEFTQFSDVTYVLPFKANSSGNEDYHMVMFRLATPMNLQTPYVRALCQPFYALPFFRSMGLVGRFSDILMYNKNIEPSYAAGYSAPLNSTGPYPLTFLTAHTSNDKLCRNTYKYYYRSEPDEIFCLIIPPAEGISKNTCLTHGTIKVFETVTPYYGVNPAFDPGRRFYSSGAISLIPRKERGQCDIHTLYYVVNIWSGLDWVKLSMICGPETYPCKNGKCIPLDQVCDGKADCSANSEVLTEDEDPIFCAATKRCKEPDSYQCGLEGKCIPLNKIGDGVEDCPTGSDEDSRILKLRNRAIEVQKGEFCQPIFPSKGVLVTCSHPQLGTVDCYLAPSGTDVTLSCDKFYKPTSKTKFVTMKCYDDKAWKPFRSFSCQPECGIVHIDPKARGKSGRENFPMKFPWHASILKKNQKGEFEYFCGGSLIERNILITSGSCTTDQKGVAYNARDMKVTFSLTPSKSSITFRDNMGDKSLYEVEEIRKPESYNAKSFQSDIAIIKLAKPVTFTDTINPICYLQKKYTSVPPTEATGRVPSSRDVESLAAEPPSLKYMDVTVVPQDKCGRINGDKFCGKSSPHEISTSDDICEGESGSGLVFLTHVQDDFQTFLLKGVVSKKEKSMRAECSGSSVASFTHLNFHSEWLLRTLQNISNIDF